MPRNRTTTPPHERFWSKVRKTETCWLWTGGTHLGYGYLEIGGRNVRAHRYSYELIKGPIPDGLVLDHLCRIKPCVNPDHLEPVTPKENNLRGVGFGAKNALKMYCSKGHPYFGSNLRVQRNGYRVCRECDREYRKQMRLQGKWEHTMRDSVGRIIRAARHDQGITVRELADLTGVSFPYISDIERGRRAGAPKILSRIARSLNIPLEEARNLYVQDAATEAAARWDEEVEV